jgi:starch synthase
MLNATSPSFDIPTNHQREAKKLSCKLILQSEENQAATKKILFVTSEYTGLIKTGGLGDVSAALPNALLAQHDVRILMPGYRQIINSGHSIDIIDELDAYAGLPACKIGRLHIATGPTIYLVICPDLYERPGSPYGDIDGNDWKDNPMRFARLSAAAATIANGRPKLSWSPDLVHANDWPTALTPAYMAWQGQTTPSVFTIHNLAHQGLCEFECAPQLGIPTHALSIDGMEFYGKLSFLKAGITYASHVTTVSETYAHEITTPAFGCGLDGLLRLKYEQGLLSGIINGIDESWEPKSDPHLVESFGPQQWDRKNLNTRYIEQIFNLPHNHAPLFAVVSRLAHQKGVDLTLKVADTIVHNGGRLVVMGCGESELEAHMMQLARRHPQQVGVDIGFDETTARRIFAGSDFLLMPSRFEPCGLSQLYAQRCASLPIARRTGGLADTIQDGLSGFLFHEATAESYRGAIHRALKVFKRPELLNAMRCSAMTAPLFWRQSIQPYSQLYHRLLTAVGREWKLMSAARKGLRKELICPT